MAKFFNVFIGLVIWGGVFFVVIFGVLDTPSYKVPFDHSTVSVAEAVTTSDITTSTEPTQLAAANSVIDSVAQTGPANHSSADGNSQDTEAIAKDNLNSAEGSETQNKKVKQAAKSSTKLPAGWYVQVGAFKNKGRAKTYGLQFSSQGYKTLFEEGKDGLTRILVGPYSSETKAVLSRNKISEQTDAKDSIVRNISAAS